MSHRRNALCFLLVLSSTSFIFTFASPVYLRSEQSSSHQYLNKRHSGQGMNNTVAHKVNDNGTQTRTDPAPFHLSLSKITDRTDIQLKSASIGPGSVPKRLLKNMMIRELQTFVDKHLAHPRDNDRQGPITYFQGKGRQQRSALFDRRSIVDFRIKRNVGVNDGRAERSVPGGKQKKAKVLGRLLMNGASNKNDVNEQDDYVDEEDEDYSRGLNDDKVNWRDYENEDGPSVMELIALSVRHQSKKWSSHEEKFGY